jgi:hypothetical protein
MRKLLVLLAVLVFAAIVAEYTTPVGDERPFEEVFQEGMNFVYFNTYTDTALDYSFSYPSFFQQETFAGDGAGRVQFGYHAHGMNMVMECRVEPAGKYRFRTANVVDSGSVASVEGYRYCSHYILRRGRWYVLTLCYPASYQQAAALLLFKVKRWRAQPSNARLGKFKPEE